MKKIFVYISLIIGCSSTMHGQSFNTIDNSRPHYKVERSVVNVTEKVSQQKDTLVASAPMTADTLSNKETKQIGSPLLVSYPLRQSKLVVSSPYGMRRHPILGKMKMHQGVDLHAKREPVYAMLPGMVVKTGYDNISGNFVTLQHASMKVSYCHLSLIGVKKGDSVYAGQPLGIAGTTGRSTGVHLHLTLKINDQPCNPMPLLKYIEQKLSNS